MNLIKRTFGSLDNKYKLKGYIISFVLTLFLYLISKFTEASMLKYGVDNENVYALKNSAKIYIGWKFLIFPFAKFAFEHFIHSAIQLFLGERFYTLPVFILVQIKIIKNCIIYFFSSILGPLGLLYLLFKTRNIKTNSISEDL